MFAIFCTLFDPCYIYITEIAKSVCPAMRFAMLGGIKNSKNVIIFQMRHVVLTLGDFKGQRLVFRLYRGQKIKLLQFS